MTGAGRARGVPAAAAALALLLAASGAAAWEVSAGWTHADVGLQHRRGGLQAGVSGRSSLGTGPFALVYACDYVQKRGAQPTLFADAVGGFVTADARVTLHCLQPTVALELDPTGGGRPRPYLGLALAVKLGESWSDFPGTPNEAYGFRDVDGVLLVGLAQRLGPLDLDVRYGLGLAAQLLVDTSGTGELPAKAVDPIPGAEAADIDARIDYLQVGLAYRF